MDKRAQSDVSAAYLVLLLAVTFVVFGLLLTMLNPFLVGLLESPFYDFSTSWGQDFAGWVGTVQSSLGLVLLFAILYTGFVRSRDPT